MSVADCNSHPRSGRPPGQPSNEEDATPGRFRLARRIARAVPLALLIAVPLAIAAVWYPCWIAATLLTGLIAGAGRGLYEAGAEIGGQARREIRNIAADLRSLGL